MATRLPADPNTPQVPLSAGLANRFPRQAEEDAAGITGANTLQMQKLAGGVSAGTTAAPTAAQTSGAGAQMATGAATAGAQAGATAGNELAGAESVRQQGQAVQTGAAQAQTTLSVEQKAQANQNKLASLSAGVSNSLVNQKMQFQSDQIGAGVLNETQLADWTVTNAKEQQSVQDNLQTIQLASQRSMQLAKAAYDKLTQTLQDAQAMADLQKKGITQQDLLAYQQQAKLAYMQAQAKMSNTSNMITGAFTIVGGVIGGIYGGPAGAAGGAMVGGAVGGAAAGVGQANGWYS